MTQEGAIFVRQSTRATRKSTSSADLVECSCGCGLMTDGVERCPKCRLGRLRDECVAAYRRCRSCPRQLFSKTLTESVYDREEVVVPSATDLVTRRCQDPSTRDQTEFRVKVLDTLPPLLRGKAFSECVHILRTYGTEEEKAHMMVSSSTLLEHTLVDAAVAVNPYIHLADLRGLRFTSTPNNLVLRWWINDRVIDHYLSLVNIKAAELGLRSCCYSTGFLDKFRIEGYGGVKRWSTKKDLKSRTAFDFERLLVPINHNNTHWTFMVAHIRQKRILYYDSNAASTRQSTGKRDMELLHRWVFSCPPSILSILSVLVIFKWKRLNNQNSRWMRYPMFPVGQWRWQKSGHNRTTGMTVECFLQWAVNASLLAFQ